MRTHVTPGLAWFSQCQMLLMLGPADCFRECSQLPAQQLNTVQCPRTHALGAEDSLFCPWWAHPMGELLRLKPTSAPSSPSAVFFLPIFSTWEVEAGLLQLWVAFSWAVQTGVVFLYILWSCFSFYLFIFLCKSWTNFDLWTVIMYRGYSHIQLVLRHRQVLISRTFQTVSWWGEERDWGDMLTVCNGSRWWIWMVWILPFSQ